MKLLLSSLLLASLCALSSWSVSSGVRVVTQTPDVSIMEGEAVNITCCWTGEFKRLTVKWLKNQTNIKSETFSNPLPVASTCSVLAFTTIRVEDSGTYTCKVFQDIPVLTVVEGEGTVISVTARENTKDNTTGGDHPGPSRDSVPLALIICLAVGAPVLIVLACFCALQRRQAQAARVIYEVPHIDSEEADMDKHSTSSSRGSSQWCQVPVYESFDYFERVQTKDSG
ncbi:uncharacterized protein LOC143317355 [Chaetodon auriga]|uniref:uncharacterized protein LOC143317355 n=1 Tax=Chaetodon auriga TaxID=39042 RepID=UPI0040330925